MKVYLVSWTNRCSIAQSFTSVVNSFISDVVLPIVSLLPFIMRNMDEKFAILSKGPNCDEENGYNTLEQARDDGALVLAYGCVFCIFSRLKLQRLTGYSIFLERAINFLGISLTLYALAQLYMVVSHDKIIKRQIKCKYCLKWISDKVSSCWFCYFEVGNIDVLGATMCKLFYLAGWEGGLNAYDVYVMI